MSKRANKKVSTIDLTELSECTSLYTMYLMAHNQSTVNLAKKLIAKNKTPIFSCKKLYEGIPRKYHSFIDSIHPSIFVNFLIIARATQEYDGKTAGIENVLFENYKKTSKEYRCNRHIAKETDIVDVALNNGEKFTPETLIRYSLSYMARSSELIDDDKVNHGLVGNILRLRDSMTVPLNGYTTDWSEHCEHTSLLKDLSCMWDSCMHTIYKHGFLHSSIVENCVVYISAIDNCLLRHGINQSDFYMEQLTQKEVKKTITDILSASTISSGMLDEIAEYLDSGDDDYMAGVKLCDEYRNHLLASEPLIVYAAAFETLAKMYSNARDVANKAQKDYLSLSVEYDNELKRNIIKEHELSLKQDKGKDKSLAAEKQKQLNVLQSKLEALQRKYDDVVEENKFLRGMLEHGDEEEPQEDSDDEDVIELDKKFPEDVLLIGGHPNWQRKFAKKYPKARILNGLDPTFSEDILRSNDVVLLNFRHMKHSVFYKVRRLQQRLGFKIIFTNNGK